MNRKTHVSSAGRRAPVALAILRRRYVEGDAKMAALVERERVNADVAAQIREIRERAGLTQQALARRVGTTASVISRLEDADYEGHSLNMLLRIAAALGRRVRVEFTDPRKKAS